MTAKIVGGIVLILAILSSYWYTFNAGVRHEKQNQIVLIAEQNEKATKDYNILWDLYQKERTNQKIVYRTIKQDVEKIVEREVYKNVCLDDEGVEQANKALRGGK